MMTTRSASRCTSSSSWLVRITQTPSDRRPATTSRTAIRPSWVDSGRRLVEEGDARPADERQREREPLLLATRQSLVGRPRNRPEPDEVDQLVGVARVVVIGGEEPDSALGAHDRVHAATLQHDADPGRELRVIGPGVEPEDPHRAGVGTSVALEGLDGRGLACAVGAEESDDLASVGVEADPVDRDQTAVADHEVVDLDGGHAERLPAPALRSGARCGSAATVRSAPRRLEPVAEAADRRDEHGLGRVLLDPRPQPLDVHVQGLGVADVVHPPDPVDQGVPGHDSARVG